MKAILPIILVVVALIFAYMGFNQLDASTTNIEIGPIDISAGDQGGQEKAYMYFGAAVVSIIGAIFAGRGKG